MASNTYSEDTFFVVDVLQMRLQPGQKNALPFVRCIDPGLKNQTGPCYRPEGLPMDEAQAESMMRRFEELARESRSVGELAGLHQGLSEDFHSGTSFAIRDQLAKPASEAELAAKRLLAARAKAQTLVCLALALEDYQAGLAGLETKLDQQWRSFEHNLGLDEDELSLDELGIDRQTPVSMALAERSVPTGLLVESVLTLLPEDVGVFTSDKELAAGWQEFGATFFPSDAPGLLEASVPGYVLALSRWADPQKPWLAGLRTAYIAQE